MRRRRPDPLTRQAALGMVAGRVAIGAGALFATGPTLRLLGLDAESRSVRILGRMAGGRDPALAAFAARSLDDAVRLREVALLGTPADAVDAVAFLLAATHRELRRAAAMSIPAALSAVALQVWLYRRLSRRQDCSLDHSDFFTSPYAAATISACSRIGSPSR